MKNIIITRAGSGLGKELSIKCAKEGHNIILVGRTIDKLKIVNDIISRSGGSTFVCRYDVTNSDDIEKLKIKIEKKYIRIYQLINCTGVGYFGSIDY
jgi:short-subunit dehydrogenase